MEIYSNIYRNSTFEDIKKLKVLYIETFSLLHMNTICLYLKRNNIKHSEIEKLDAYTQISSNNFHGFIQKYFCQSWYIKLTDIDTIKKFNTLKNVLFKILVTKNIKEL